MIVAHIRLRCLFLPHKLGGGHHFAEYQFTYVRAGCEFCNLNAGNQCDATTGQEAITSGECYRDAIDGGQVELTPPNIEEDRERQEATTEYSLPPLTFTPPNGNIFLQSLDNTL